MWFRSTEGPCSYLPFSLSATERLISEIRPVNTAYMAAASVRFAVELPGKLTWSNKLVGPVLAGSFVAIASVITGNIAPPTFSCQLLIWMKLPPKFNRCNDLAQLRLSVKLLVGVLRRDWLDAR